MKFVELDSANWSTKQQKTKLDQSNMIWTV